MWQLQFWEENCVQIPTSFSQDPALSTVNSYLEETVNAVNISLAAGPSLWVKRQIRAERRIKQSKYCELSKQLKKNHVFLLVNVESMTEQGVP